ncbi:Rho termination factor N-terminal domain-containing protein [Mycoplasma phocoeninasale]|uniref:Rho termination factor N-terminal domain-containing protein n=1 Tax=Mycoplasma phocoeninasale TaxID=2726117 RepID=UPI001967106F|nr:Rho termination factor N-terminal domain-containing protein [Mycoplasma phocoeninasale]MBN0970858.1 hypothetical protein [Mycoplasma phocoeninasale]
MFETNFAKYNSTKELYDERKKKYWLLFFIFTAVFASIILFQLGILIEYSVRKEYYIDNYINVIESTTQVADANRIYSGSLLGFVFLTLIFISLFIWHVLSMYKVKKFQDFSAYSLFLSKLYLFLIILQIVILLFSGIRFFQSFAWDLNRNLRIFLTVFFIAGYFATWPFLCNRVIRIFYALKIDIAQRNNNDSLLNPFQSFFNGQFGQSFNSENSSQSPQTAAPILMTDSSDDHKIDYDAKLNELSKEQLVTMAEKLNIYGAKEFSKEDLIAKIIAIFKEKEQKSNLKSNSKSTGEKENSEEMNTSYNDDNKTDDEKFEEN